MKDGLYYQDIRTGETLKCVTFTRSCHVFLNRNNVKIERPKYAVYKQVKSKKTIQEFEKNIKDKEQKYVKEPHIIGGWDAVMAFKTIYE